MASLRYAEGFAALRQTTRQLVNKTTSGASLELRVATPDYETTSQQDNKWRLRKATLTLRRNHGIMELRNYGTGATPGDRK